MKLAHLCSTVAACAVLSIGSPAFGGDLKDVLSDAARPLSGGVIGTFLDCNFSELCGGTTFPEFVIGSGISLTPVSDFTFSIVNDRIVPLSSSVSGFTYEYNQDLDVYERSTTTFGPLFNERAQTIGQGRFLAGASHSYFEFDEFNGVGLDDIQLSELEGFAGLSSQSVNSQLGVGSVVGGSAIDLNFDVEIKESVSTLYFTYGITDRIDIGIVAPFVSIDIDAKVRPTVRGQAAETLPICGDTTDPRFQVASLDECLIGAAPDTIPPPLVLLGEDGNTPPPPTPTPTPMLMAPALFSQASDSHTGIGDVVVRGKWHMVADARTNAAALVSVSLPTGDEDNLAGLGDPSVTPGFVVSRDFDTGSMGLGIHGFGGYEFRGDDSDKNEIKWGAGGSFQPFGRTSMSLDVLGNKETGGDKFNVVDLSLGLKLMLGEGLLLDFNFITPLNDDGLRPNDGIISGQLEFVFGD